MHAQIGSNYINSTLKFHILGNVLLGIYNSGRSMGNPYNHLIQVKKVKIHMIANTLLYSSQGNILVTVLLESIDLLVLLPQIHGLPALDQ